MRHFLPRLNPEYLASLRELQRVRRKPGSDLGLTWADVVEDAEERSRPFPGEKRFTVLGTGPQAVDTPLDGVYAEADYLAPRRGGKKLVAHVNEWE